MDLKVNRAFDRRQNPRWVVDSSEVVMVNLAIDEQILSGVLTSIGKNGMVILCQGFAPPSARTNSSAPVQATILIPNLNKSFIIDNLLLSRLNENGQDSFKILLVAADNAAKAKLWSFSYQIHFVTDPIGQQKRVKESEIPKIPGRGHYTEAARQERITFIRSKSQAPMSRLDRLDLIPERLSSNIENLIGSVEIPVGLGGPLLFNGTRAKGIIFAPFATTEGALVASVTRGATAMSRSGGVTTRVLKQQMIRVPFFRFQSLSGAIAFSNWISDYFDEIKRETRKVSRFAKLTSLEPLISGCAVHVRFIYETGDAAGQNMTTTCTWHASLWILEQLKLHPLMTVEHFMIDGNVSGDKKVNYMSFLQGRGIRVTAECYLYDEDLEKVLKVKGSELERAFQLISQGALRTGMIGINVNIANVIAAIFTATGQDIACVHESSLGILNIECIEGGIYASLLLPSLIIGTVGGGTSLPDQAEYLQMMGCNGTRNAFRLAEIIAGYCLALDLSTLGALASGQFAIAHEKLGRNRPVRTLEFEELNSSFLQNILDKAPTPWAQKISHCTHLPRKEEGNSIITELTSRRLAKLMGLFPVKVQFDDKTEANLMLKIKPIDSEVLLMMNSVASMCHPVLAKAFRVHHQNLGFLQCHRRELHLFRQTDPRFIDHSPRCYGTLEDPSRELFLVLMENVENIAYMNCSIHPGQWNQAAIAAVVDGLAALQSIWWKRESELRQQTWIGAEYTKDSMQKMTELWEAFAIHAAGEFPVWFTHDLLQENSKIIQELPSWWSELESMPRTLIHNDFNPRNLGLREGPLGLKLCAYDWELATIQVPQHDLAEFLLFTLSDTSPLADVEYWVDRHRLALMKATGDSISSSLWRRGFTLSLKDLMINRVPLYIMAHTLHHYSFIRRITQTCRHLLKITSSWE